MKRKRRVDVRYLEALTNRPDMMSDSAAAELQDRKRGLRSVGGRRRVEGGEVDGFARVRLQSVWSIEVGQLEVVEAGARGGRDLRVGKNAGSGQVGFGCGAVVRRLEESQGQSINQSGSWDGGGDSDTSQERYRVQVHE